MLSAPLSGAQSAEEVFQRAASALASQDYAAAERGFQAVLKTEPGNVGALGNLGVVYSRTQRYGDAIDAYRLALRIAPGDKGLSTNLGLAYLKADQFTAAMPIFEKLARDPANLQARELLATCEVSLSDYPAALGVLQPLVKDEPGNAGVLYMLGVALTHLKRKDEAHGAFTAMMNSVTPAQADFLMGKASYETGDFEQAAAFLRKTLTLDPAFDGAHRELGKTLISLRDDESAEKELRQAGAEDAEALYFLGALVGRTRPREAIPLLGKAHERNPGFWGPLYYLGRIHLEQGQVNEAVLRLENAAKLNPEEPAIQYQLGRAFQKAGKEAEAQGAFAKVRELKSKSLRREVDLLHPSQ